MFLGLFLFGLGIVMTIKSDLGTMPWDAFHLGVANYMPLTFGEVSQLTGAIIILLSFTMGIKPGWGSIANMYFIGFFADRIMLGDWIPIPNHWFFQLAMLLAGVWVVGWGSFFYMSAAFGTGPRDSFMVGAITKTGWPVWKMRTIIETTVATIGYLLGGPVGIGSIIIAFTLGPAVQSAFAITGKRVQDIRHDTLVSKVEKYGNECN